VFLAPAVIGLLGDLETPAHRGDVGAFTEQAIGFAQLALGPARGCDVGASP
jgi:hypothetical protein